MLKIIRPSCHLNQKLATITVTNACNLHCGGCNQHCGKFHSSKVWFIEEDIFVKSIYSIIQYAIANWGNPQFPEYNKFICIFGGEPTIHPAWSRLIEIINTFTDYPFVVYTNGHSFKPILNSIDAPVCGRGNVYSQVLEKPLPRSGWKQFLPVFQKYPAHDKNIAYNVDYKPTNFRAEFFPALVAPIDVLGIQDTNYYWRLAQQQCYHWLGKQFEITIYNGKAYYCQVAAAFDWLYNHGENGWEIDENKNPFDKTSKEISEQASRLCYRCGFCLGNASKLLIKKQQLTNEPSLITLTNITDNIKLHQTQVL